jgi:hypothetical protein
MRKSPIVLVVVLVCLFGLIGCGPAVDDAIIGLWSASDVDFSIDFKADGSAVLGNTAGVANQGWAAIFMFAFLGADFQYTAADGSGEWWADYGLLGESDPVAFTYTISGTTLTTDAFWGDQISYTLQ